MNSGSVDSLNVCERCGAGTNARQILEIADSDIPVVAAIDRVDQCVAFFGVSSRVLTITRSTPASVIFRGTPGRGPSCMPSRPARGAAAARRGPSRERSQDVATPPRSNVPRGLENDPGPLRRTYSVEHRVERTHDSLIFEGRGGVVRSAAAAERHLTQAGEHVTGGRGVQDDALDAGEPLRQTATPQTTPTIM